MKRIAYEVVEPKVWELTNKMVVEKNLLRILDYMQQIEIQLESFGWSPNDFWKEMEKRVDAGWDPEVFRWN